MPETPDPAGRRPRAVPASTAAALERAVRAVAEDEGVSASRMRQVRWVAGELLRAAAHPDFPALADDAGLGDLLAADKVSAYLDLAARGELRQRAAAGDGRSGTASRRVRTDCLAILARGGGAPAQLPERLAPPALRELVPSTARSVLRDHVRAQAERRSAGPGRVRLFALMAVVLDTGARSGELCALRVDDLADDLRAVRLVRRPQARSVAPPQEERAALTETAALALRGWLAVRAEIVAPLEGAKTALWVSVRSNHAGELAHDGHAVFRPPGMPLRPRGLARAYTRAVTELNVEMAHTPGWQPLPYRLEQLRRAVTGDAGPGEPVEPV